MNREVLMAIVQARQAGERMAVVTIVSTRGSTPRKAGSQMVVYRDGTIQETIGGGCAEAEVRLQALHAMDENKSRLYHLSLLEDAAAEEGMVCGGTMEVFIQII